MSTAQTTARKRKPKAVAVMETVICHVCGNIVPKDNSLEFDGKNLCSHCCDIETFICDRCNKRLWNDDNAGDYENQLCQKCYDRYYTRCGDCGIVICKDNAYYFEGNNQEPYCFYCYNKQREDVTIHNYSY